MEMSMPGFELAPSHTALPVGTGPQAPEHDAEKYGSFVKHDSESEQPFVRLSQFKQSNYLMHYTATLFGQGCGQWLQFLRFSLCASNMIFQIVFVGACVRNAHMLVHMLRQNSLLRVWMLLVCTCNMHECIDRM